MTRRGIGVALAVASIGLAPAALSGDWKTKAAQKAVGKAAREGLEEAAKNAAKDEAFDAALDAALPDAGASAAKKAKHLDADHLHDSGGGAAEGFESAM